MIMARLDVMESFCGISFPGHHHTQESLHHATEFKFQESDILIVTYPKSGTTWMQEVLTLIKSKGDTSVCQSVPNWARAPWLEHIYFPMTLKELQEPRVITTHLPVHLLGNALQGSKARIIYVARNPKDVAVSFYHFHQMARFLPETRTFEEFLNSFLEGEVSYGSWFDHVKGWTAQMQNTSNFFYITYEEMWMDPRGSVERISTFLQRPLLEAEIHNVVKHSSFAQMRESVMVNYTTVPSTIMDHSKGRFMRNGKIGDWRNIFTPEQNQKFEEIFQSAMKNSSLKFVWDASAGLEISDETENLCLNAA